MLAGTTPLVITAVDSPKPDDPLGTAAQSAERKRPRRRTPRKSRARQTPERGPPGGTPLRCDVGPLSASRLPWQAGAAAARGDGSLETRPGS